MTELNHTNCGDERKNSCCCFDEELDTLDFSTKTERHENWAEQLLLQNSDDKEIVELHTLFLVDGFVTTGTGFRRHCRYKVGRLAKNNSVGNGTNGTVQNVVYRRFSDFCSLYQQLVEQMPHALIPMHPVKVASMQIKAVNSSAMRELCEERAEWCHAFLSALLRRPGLVRESEWLRHFLFDATEEWQGRLDFCAVLAKEHLINRAKTNAMKFQSAIVDIPNWLPLKIAPAEEAVARNCNDGIDLTNSGNDSVDGNSLSSTGTKKVSSFPGHLNDSLSQLKDWWASLTKFKNIPIDNGHSRTENSFDKTQKHRSSSDNFREESGVVSCPENDFEPEWKALQDAHSLLCCSPVPIEEYVSIPFDQNVFSWGFWENRVVLLGHGTTKHRVHIKIDHKEDRLQALEHVANGLFNTLRHIQLQTICLANCADAFALLTSGNTDSQGNDDDSCMVDHFVIALRGALQADNHFLETLKSRHEKEVALDLVLRSSLIARGGQETLKRCAQLRAAVLAEKQTGDSSIEMCIRKGSDAKNEDKKYEVDGTANNDTENLSHEIEIIREKLSSTAHDFREANHEIIADMTTAVIRIVDVGIERAHENQRVFKALLDFLKSDKEMAAKLDVNNTRLGISSDDSV